jgi:anti-sigma regulatory factor (Ser/Thr protein kinase)
MQTPTKRTHSDPEVLRILADLSRLADVRQFVRTGATARGATPEAVADLVQAVDESVTNVIVHGYGGSAGPIEVELSSSGSTVSAVVRDEAPPFDPTTVPVPDLARPPTRRRPGGMGVHLARDLCDQYRYRRHSRGNELTLVRSLGARSKGEVDGHHD